MIWMILIAAATIAAGLLFGAYAACAMFLIGMLALMAYELMRAPLIEDWDEFAEDADDEKGEGGGDGR